MSTPNRIVQATFLPKEAFRASLAQVVSYHEKVINHYQNPPNVGARDKNNTNVCNDIVGAPAYGGVMKPQIKVDEKGQITVQNGRLARPPG